MFLREATLIKQGESDWYIVDRLPCEIIVKGNIELEDMDVLKDRRVLKAMHPTGKVGFVYLDSDGFKAIKLKTSARI